MSTMPIMRFRPKKGDQIAAGPGHFNDACLHLDKVAILGTRGSLGLGHRYADEPQHVPGHASSQPR